MADEKSKKEKQSSSKESDVLSGDILTQLESENATVQSLFLVEKTSEAHLKKMLELQAETNYHLSSLQESSRESVHVLSSVDSSLKKILQKLDKIAELANPYSGKPFSNSDQKSDSSNQLPKEPVISQIDGIEDLNSAVSDVGDKLDDSVNLSEDIRDTVQSIAQEIPELKQSLIKEPNIKETPEIEKEPPTPTVNQIDGIWDLDATMVEVWSRIDDSIPILEDIRDSVNSIVTELPNLKSESSKEEESKTESDEQKKKKKEWSGIQDLLDMDLKDIGPEELGTSEDFKKLISSAGSSLGPSFGGGSPATGGIIKGAGQLGGDVAGEIAGQAAGDAISAALLPELGPLAPVVGEAAGDIIGDAVSNSIGAVMDALGELIDNLLNKSTKNRDTLLQAGFEKIRSDVKAMATYSIEIYESATQKIYDAWDKNLGQITATQGYTKEALNSLQDAVAQRLQEEGYGNAINAADYADALANTLNAKLGGQLAEAFASQNLILQKAVPEVDLSSMASDFAAIYARAQKDGSSGEDAMIRAMNQIAGATKALEEVTEGNNQFINQIGSFLKKSEEIVNRAGGNADQIAELATQMMAAEAPLASLAPELSGFTSELVDILTKNNDATAVSLRAIMNDINSNIGVSATDFMKSFMEDTQGTLATAFQAIQNFIDANQDEGARQEFLEALTSVFGIEGSKLAQIDFGDLAKQVADASTQVNIQALTAAENLLKAGETTTLEEQLVNNTANQLLATNALADTIDNKLMRKLEKNELNLERVVYELGATQSVDLAESTLGFFTKVFDVVMGLLDPLGLFSGLMSIIDASTSAQIDAERYLMTATASSIGSSVANSTAAASKTFSNTVGGAMTVIAAGETKSLTLVQDTLEELGTADTFDEMFKRHADTIKASNEAIEESNEAAQARTVSALEAQTKQDSDYQEKQSESAAQEAEYERQRAEAAEAQRVQEEEERTIRNDNHDNLEIIKNATEKLDNLSDYLAPILQENKDQNTNLKDLKEQVDEIVKLFSTVLEYQITTSPGFAATISYDEKARIMNNGYVGGLGNGAAASLF